MAFFPPEDEYQNRVNTAWSSHVASSLRGELKGDGDMSDMSDDQVIRYHKDTYAGDLTPDQYSRFLHDTYNKSFQKPSPTFMEGAGNVARGVQKELPSIGRQIAEQTTAEGGAAKLVGKEAMRKVAAPILGGSYLARMLVQKHAADTLGKIADAMPEPNYDQLYNHYYDSLAPRLQSEGMSLDDIAKNVHKRVSNVVRGYVDTQNSLMGDVDRTSQDYLQSAGDASANIALGGIGGGVFKDVLESGARKFMGKKAAQQLEKTVAGRVLTHTVTGGGIGAVYGGAKDATEAWYKGGSAIPSLQTAGQAVKSGVHGALSGAAAGAVLGGVMGSVGESTKPAMNRLMDAIGVKAKVDAAIATPSPIEKPPGTLAPQHFERGPGIQGREEGLAPRGQEPPLGSPEWWAQSEGIEKPQSPLRTPLDVEKQPTREGVPAPLTGIEPRPAMAAPKPLDITAPAPRGQSEPVELGAQKGTNPNNLVRAVARTHNESVGLQRPEEGTYHPLDAEKGRAIAAAYDALPKTPKAEDEPATRASYDALNRETAEQYKALKAAGYTFEFTDKDPYNSSAEMQADLRNKHIKVFAAGEGHHPYMTPEQTNIFRAVHDVFGHGAEGFQFGPRGEDNAWRKHAQMFSDEAIPALTTETRGQNSWVNFSPGHEDMAQKDRPFAEQKAGLLPPWTHEEAMNRPRPEGGAAIEPQPRMLPSESVSHITKTIQGLGGAIEGADVAVRPSADGNRLTIDSIKGAEHGAGASGKALDRIVATADAHGVPIDVTVSDQRSPRGGTVSAEKQAQWYEKRGFVRTNEGPGSVSLHRAVPDPNPPLSKEDLRDLLIHHFGEVNEHPDMDRLEAFLDRVKGLPEGKTQEAAGNVTEGKPMILGSGQSGQPSVGMRLGGWLDQQAAAADQRIQQKLGRLNTGFDPTLIGDYAIKAAAKMYRLGMSAVQAIRREMLKDHPDIPKDQMQVIIGKARDIIQERLNGDNVTIATLKQLLDRIEEGKPGMKWYDETSQKVGKMFGADAPMFLRMLAATSGGKSTDGNVTLALKAYGQWKLGLPFDGFLTNEKNFLERAVRGEVFGDRKIQGINGALAGDPNAVAIDRHVMRSLGFENAGTVKGNLSDKEYDFFEALLRDLAQHQGMTPRQLQSTMWTSPKVRQAQVSEAAGDKRGLSYVHSFRPYEGILKFEHGIHDEEGGKTPVEWVNDNRVTLQQIANASEGVNATRAGGGFTYNPNDFSAYKGNHGLVVPLVSVKIPTARLSAAEVMDFTQKFRKVLSSFYGVNTGTFNLEQAGEPGMSSMDLNVVLPEAMRDRAIALGKARQQHSLWDLAKGEVVETGYTGPKADAPADPNQRRQWWGKQREQLDQILRDSNIPGRALPEAEIHPGEPHQRLASSSEFWGIEAENAIPSDVHKALDAAKTPEELNQVIASNEPALAASLKKAGLAADGSSLRGDGSATDLLRYFLEKKHIDHQIVLGQNDAGDTRVWVKTQNGAELDPSGEGMRNGEVVRNTSEPELRRGQIEAMIRTPHRWDIYAEQALNKTHEEIHSLVDEGELKPITEAGLLDHVEVHKDGSVWEYVDPSAENSYNIIEKVADFREQPVTQVLRYLDGKHILTGHDVVQDMKGQAGFIALPGADRLDNFAKANPPSKVNAALMSYGGKFVKPEDFRHQKPSGVSLWIDPTGKTVEVPFHLRSADGAIKKLKLKNPVKYDGPEHEELQTILNLGYVRVQLHENAYASDATRPLTDAQVQVLRQLRRGNSTQRAFAGRLVNANGEHRVVFDDDTNGPNSINKYIAEAAKEVNLRPAKGRSK